MKFVIKTILIAVFCSLAGVYLPFWSLAAVAFIISLMVRTGNWASFFAGFLAVFALWTVLAWSTDQDTHSILTERVTQIFMGISNLALILITGFIGGLVGGLGAASGSLLASLAARKKNPGYYS